MKILGNTEVNVVIHYQSVTLLLVKSCITLLTHFTSDVLLSSIIRHVINPSVNLKQTVTIFS